MGQNGLVAVSNHKFICLLIYFLCDDFIAYLLCFKMVFFVGFLAKKKYFYQKLKYK